MGLVFLDSSAAVKLYHDEAGSAAVQDLVLRSSNTCLISRLSVVEVRSAIAGKVRSGVIAPVDEARLRYRFDGDMASGIFSVIALTGDHYTEAAVLIERYGASAGLRTLDSLQLAVAIGLQRAGTLDGVVTADRILARTAETEGIRVIDPESSLE